jgi:Na+/melibiose symporter-like transporter
LETKNSKTHYQGLLQDISFVDNRLVVMDASSPMTILDKELGAIENEIVPLTKQTPYTLLMMRVVEIGLPLLLSIFSIFFILRYTLTEKRSREIKELLKQRNAERSNQTNLSGDQQL